MVSDDNNALRSSPQHSLMDSSSSCSQAVHVHVFWGSGFGGRPEGRDWDLYGWVISKSSLLLKVSPKFPTPALVNLMAVFVYTKMKQFPQNLHTSEVELSWIGLDLATPKGLLFSHVHTHLSHFF